MTAQPPPAQPPLARPPGPPALPPNAPAPPLAPPVPAPAQPAPPAAGTGPNAIPWGPLGIVPPTTSLTAAPVGDRSGFVGGLLPNSPSAPFTNPAPGSMPPSPQVPDGTRLPGDGAECIAFEVPQSMTGLQSAFVLGCIQVAAGQWACSADQLASPVSAPTCSIPRLQPHCSTAPRSIPPATPGATSVALLGCLSAGPKHDESKFKCALAMPASVNGAPGNEAASAGTCLAERRDEPKQEGGGQDEASVFPSRGFKVKVGVVLVWVAMIAQVGGW